MILKVFNTPFLHFATANKTLEENLQGMNTARDETVAELKEKIQGLEKELDNANDLLSTSKLRGHLGLVCVFVIYI